VAQLIAGRAAVDATDKVRTAIHASSLVDGASVRGGKRQGASKSLWAGIRYIACGWEGEEALALGVTLIQSASTPTATSLV
jgi:hypothetical protein